MATSRRHISASVKAQVFERFGRTCWLGFDGCTHVADTVDHIMPYRLGGSDRVDNLRPACKHCNSKRADRLVQGHGTAISIMLGNRFFTTDKRIAVIAYTRIGNAMQLDSEAQWAYNASVEAYRSAAYYVMRTPRKTMNPTVLMPAPELVTREALQEWVALGYDVHDNTSQLAGGTPAWQCMAWKRVRERGILHSLPRLLEQQREQFNRFEL